MVGQRAAGDMVRIVWRQRVLVCQVCVCGGDVCMYDVSCAVIMSFEARPTGKFFHVFPFFHVPPVMCDK